MDSGNSGSIQSSSSGDEEYDSKYEGSISTFLNSSTPFCSSPLPQFLLNQHEPMKFFDNPQDTQNFNSNIFLDSPNSSSYYNNDLISLTSDPIYNNFANFTHQGDSTLTTTTSKTKSSNIDHKSNDHVMKKKRRRATRKAPTTVLTTDTTNFREMVQEFTGIPTTPFTGPAYTRRGRCRLDLLSSTATSAIRSSSHLDNFEHLFTRSPLTASTQNVQNCQNLTPSTLVMPNDSIVSATTTIIPSLDAMGMCATRCNSQDVGGYI